ncbi:MAG: extracellular solute-binding protein [Clostridiales bacterium]|nr:extracellular solute-binding protein [Clostridiales bacterium]
MKKIKKSISLAIVIALVLTLLFACAPPPPPTGPGDNTVPDVIEDDSDREGWVSFEKESFAAGSKLRIKFFNGGYGRAWIDAMKTKFEADYPGVEVILTSSNKEADFTSTISTTLAGSNADDIYICHNIPWEKLSVQSLVMNLDNLYNSVIYTDTKNDNAPIRYVDRIATSSLNGVKFNGHFYKVPEVQGAGGIAYNKGLFDANGWSIPTTYAEFVTLCQTISGSGVKGTDGKNVVPFVWSGTEAYIWDSLVYDWWVQIAGIDEFNQFMKYEDKNMFNSAEFPALKTAWTYWYDLVAENPAFSHPESLALDNLQSNMAFAAGQAAMMPATCWIANEIGDEMLNDFSCDIGLFPTPFVPEAKKDGENNPIRVTYDLAGKDSFIIAQKGKNKLLAQEFFKWMALEENALLFPQNTNGLLLAIRYDFQNLIDKVATSTWEREMFGLLQNTTRFNLYSQSPLVYSSGSPLSPYPDGNYYLEAVESYGTASPRTPDAVFNGVWTRIDREWDQMLAGVGL